MLRAELCIQISGAMSKHWVHAQEHGRLVAVSSSLVGASGQLRNVVQGFKASSLLRLAGLKSADKCSSFLEFLVEECWRDSKTVLVLAKQLSAVKRAAPLQVSLQHCVLSVCLAVAEHAPAAVVVLSMLWLALTGAGNPASKRAFLHFVAMTVQVADLIKRTTELRTGLEGVERRVLGAKDAGNTAQSHQVVYRSCAYAAWLMHVHLPLVFCTPQVDIARLMSSALSLLDGVSICCMCTGVLCRLSLCALAESNSLMCVNATLVCRPSRCQQAMATSVSSNLRH